MDELDGAPAPPTEDDLLLSIIRNYSIKSSAAESSFKDPLSSPGTVALFFLDDYAVVNQSMLESAPTLFEFSLSLSLSVSSYSSGGPSFSSYLSRFLFFFILVAPDLAAWLSDFSF